MENWITGGAYITQSGYGKMSDKSNISIGTENINFPPVKEVFSRPLTRFGRFDNYTKIGCLTIGMAMRDAGIADSGVKRDIGIISSSKYECFETDINFYQTTLEQDGFISSPNLFSYTLPGIMLGECAICFGLTGPVFSVSESKNLGMAAITAACRFLNNPEIQYMVAGWLDYPPKEVISKNNSNDIYFGGIFVVISSMSEKLTPHSKKIIFENNKISFENGSEVLSILDFFVK